MLDFDGTRKARRKDFALACAVLALALVLLALSPTYQKPIRTTFQSTILRPFLGAQTRLAIRRSRTEDLSVVRAQRDSLAALVAAEATLSEENTQLRGIIGMRARIGNKFIPAEVVRLGSGGAESTFIVNVGSADSVHAGSAVITPEGLLGVVWEVDTHSATAIDWSHSQFRASGMTADGSSIGILEPRRGRFREDDLIALSGASFTTNISPGKRVVTTGRGDVFPRGIPVGTIIGIDEADTGWRKSYLVRPAVRPEQARHVLVGIGDSGSADLSANWNINAPPDTTQLGDTASVKATTKTKTPARTPAKAPRPNTPPVNTGGTL